MQPRRDRIVRQLAQPLLGPPAPKGHPERDNPDYIVTACIFCNTADNRYFDLAVKRGITFKGRSLEELVAQRLPFVEKTRDSYRTFWDERVCTHPPAAATTESASALWTLRSGWPADAKGVVTFWRAAGLEPSATDDPDNVRALCARDAQALILAESRGEIVGTVIATFDGWRANLYRLAIHPTLRRHGLARALVTEAERRLIKRGAARITALVVAKQHDATGFWEAAGYEHDHRMARYVRTLGPTTGGEARRANDSHPRIDEEN